MRQIEKEMVNAFNNGYNFKKSNTEVNVCDGYVNVYLHGNKIARKNLSTGKVGFSSCGWLTNATKSRLNALGANIYQKAWEWFNADGTPFVNTLYNV